MISPTGERPDHSHADARDTLKVPPKQSDRRPAVAAPDQVTFRWVIHTVTGDDGRKVRAAQAKAIKELLTWLDNQRRDTS